MRIRNFMLADAVAASADGKAYIHGGGITSVTAASFPATHPQLAVYLVLEREDEQFGTEHTLDLRIVSASGASVGGTQTVGVVAFRPGEIAGIPEHVTVAATFVGFAFPEAGLYYVIAVIDGDEAAHLPLAVLEASSAA
jgi:hypothetical protein